MKPISKLEPREMLRVSLVAKKLHEVIDYINEMGDMIEDQSGSELEQEGNREDGKARDKEDTKEDNTRGSERPSDMAQVEKRPT